MKTPGTELLKHWLIGFQITINNFELNHGRHIELIRNSFLFQWQFSIFAQNPNYLTCVQKLQFLWWQRVTVFTPFVSFLEAPVGSILLFSHNYFHDCWTVSIFHSVNILHGLRQKSLFKSPSVSVIFCNKIKMKLQLLLFVVIHKCLKTDLVWRQECGSGFYSVPVVCILLCWESWDPGYILYFIRAANDPPVLTITEKGFHIKDTIKTQVA